MPNKASPSIEREKQKRSSTVQKIFQGGKNSGSQIEGEFFPSVHREIFSYLDASKLDERAEPKIAIFISSYGLNV